VPRKSFLCPNYFCSPKFCCAQKLFFQAYNTETKSLPLNSILPQTLKPGYGSAMKRSTSNLKTRFCLLCSERRLFPRKNVERNMLETQRQGDVNRRRRGAEISFKNNSSQKILGVGVVFCIAQKVSFVVKGNHCQRMDVLRPGLFDRRS